MHPSQFSLELLFSITISTRFPCLSSSLSGPLDIYYLSWIKVGPSWVEMPWVVLQCLHVMHHNHVLLPQLITLSHCILDLFSSIQDAVTLQQTSCSILCFSPCSIRGVVVFGWAFRRLESFLPTGPAGSFAVCDVLWRACQFWSRVSQGIRW